MTLPLLIVGLILALAGPWFRDQHTVGVILVIAGAVGLIWQVVVWGAVASRVKRWW